MGSSSLSGALLAFGTSLALLVSAETGVPFVGALVFPVGFAIIVILGLELLTSNFGIVPLAVLAHRATLHQLLANEQPHRLNWERKPDYRTLIVTRPRPLHRYQ
jgi:formate/nitrite transporter FocA (FNT family)